MTNNTYGCTGWEAIRTLRGLEVIRVPITNDSKKLFYRPRELEVDCLGIPVQFKDGVEFRYLVKNVKTMIVEVWILDKPLSSFKEGIDYAMYTTKKGLTSYEVREKLWKRRLYDSAVFPSIARKWSIDLPEDFKMFANQLKLL